MIYFTSDTHYGHKFMADLRGFASVDEMDEWLERSWNSVVGPKDEVWHLGDFSFLNAEKTEAVFTRLNGRKHLVVGNHDPNRVLRLGWASVQHMKYLKWEGHSFVLCHYPLMTWQNAQHDAVHLHGHCHGNLRAEATRRLDVGVDAIGVDPLPISLAWEKLIRWPLVPVDHHYA